MIFFLVKEGLAVDWTFENERVCWSWLESFHVKKFYQESASRTAGRRLKGQYGHEHEDDN